MKISFHPTAYAAYEGMFRVLLRPNGTWEALCGRDLIAVGCASAEEAFDACATYLRTAPDNDVTF